MRDIKSKLPSLYAQVNSLLEAKRGELETDGSYLKLDTTEDRDSVLIDEFRENTLSIPSAKEAPAESVQNEESMNRSLSIPEQSFHTLVKKEIKKLGRCVLDCIEEVQELLVGRINRIEVPNSSSGAPPLQHHHNRPGQRGPRGEVGD
jgi:hypothetical protein